MTALATVADPERHLRLEVDSLTGADYVAAEDALQDVSVLVQGAAHDASLPKPWSPASVHDDVRGAARDLRPAEPSTFG